MDIYNSEGKVSCQNRMRSKIVNGENNTIHATEGCLWNISKDANNPLSLGPNRRGPGRELRPSGRSHMLNKLGNSSKSYLTGQQVRHGSQLAILVDIKISQSTPNRAHADLSEGYETEDQSDQG